MRVLHLSNKPIYPKIDGGCVAMEKMVELMQRKKYSVKHLCISTYKHPFKLENYPGELAQSIQPETVEVATKIKLFPAITAFLQGKSYHVERFYSSEFEQKLQDLFTQENFDIILCESIFLLPYLHIFRTHSSAKIIVRTHNVEHRIWRGLAKNNRRIKAWCYGKLAASLQKFEVEYLQQVDGMLCISKNDAAQFRKLGITTPSTTIPPQVDTKVPKVDYASTHFHHLGAMNWEPNKEAVQLLIDVIFPAIRKQLPQAELHLAGSFFPNSIQTDEKNGIFVHGFIENRFAFMQEHGIQLIPLQSGSGVRIKLIESMANGVPILTTPTGVEGIENARTVLEIADDTEKFIQLAVELHKNKNARKENGEKGRQLVKDAFSIENCQQQLHEFISNIS